MSQRMNAELDFDPRDPYYFFKFFGYNVDYRVRLS